MCSGWYDVLCCHVLGEHTQFISCKMRNNLCLACFISHKICTKFCCLECIMYIVWYKSLAHCIRWHSGDAFAFHSGNEVTLFPEISWLSFDLLKIFSQVDMITSTITSINVKHAMAYSSILFGLNIQSGEAPGLGYWIYILTVNTFFSCNRYPWGRRQCWFN